MYDVYAIKLTEENIPRIEEATRPLGWTLDHLQDNLESNADLLGFDTMLYMKLFQGSTEIATFSDEAIDPMQSIRMTDTIDPLFEIFYKLDTI